MKKIGLLLVCMLLSIACGSSVKSNRSSLPSATNTDPKVNAYSKSENAYTLAQNTDLARELTPSGKEAREIVGKTMTESNLWQHKHFQKRLRALMGPAYAAMRRFWNVETPIKKFGDFLMMTGCEQHNCSNNQYIIFIDLGDGQINVFHIGKDATKVWNAGHDIDLPPPFVEELSSLKAGR